MKNMLGNNEVLRRMWSGPLLTFLERLNGESGEEWETAFDRFLRKEEIAWDGKFQIEIDLDQQPEIPDWADKKSPIIKHTPCGVFDPRKLEIHRPIGKDEGRVAGEEFLSRIAKWCKENGKIAHNATSFDFFRKKESWKYLPGKESGVDVIVFPETEFRVSGGRRCVRYLVRNGSEWCVGFSLWLGSKFGSDCCVAVSQVSPQTLES
ncbi:MAG TPA: hypothetical protein VJH63_01975 [Candidatus Paceibacterota bacterium]